MTETARPELDPRALAGIQLLERTGAREFRIGYSHEDDGEPVVWYATATWSIDVETRRPVANYGHTTHEAAAAINPVDAVLRLCEQVIDGGECTHCHLPTIFLDDAGEQFPLDRMGCVYAWDPELATFRRSCEGDTP